MYSRGRHSFPPPVIPILLAEYFDSFFFTRYAGPILAKGKQNCPVRLIKIFHQLFNFNCRLRYPHLSRPYLSVIGPYPGIYLFTALNSRYLPTRLAASTSHVDLLKVTALFLLVSRRSSSKRSSVTHQAS